MILGHNLIKKIEGLLEKNHTVELRLEEGDPVPKPAGGIMPRPLQVVVYKRPDDEKELPIIPVLLDEAGPTVLRLTAVKGGQEPVVLPDIVVPAGYWVAGIKGYQGISQEITEDAP